MNNSSSKLRAFTIVELLAVFVVAALCAATLLPALARTTAPAQRIRCANNLRGIGQAFLMFGQAHGDAFPMRVAVANGGYSDLLGQRTITPNSSSSRGVFGFFRCLSNELSTPKALVCPAENERRLRATTFDGVAPVNSPAVVPLTNDLNVSYFVGADALETNPRGFLAGDHNLGSDGNLTPIRGFVTAPSAYSPSFNVSLGTNFAVNAGVGWLKTMHSSQGNVGLADGSVSQFNRVQLQSALRNSGLNPNPVFAPAFPNPIGCFGFAKNRIQFP